MYEDISIKLNPYLGCSKNLMEYFAIIGYEEKILNHYSPDIIENQEKMKLSVISHIISDLAYDKYDINNLIQQVYPNKPHIIKIIKSDMNIPKSSNVIFYSCFDVQDGSKKVFHSCYALRYYEKFSDNSKNEYYVPKALLILSQYPYFTTFMNICSKIKKYNNDFSNENSIPIEILIYCIVNFIPSPIINNLILTDFQPQIFVPKLTSYPYIDFDLCKIFNFIPIKEFIKVFVMMFLEIELLFFSPDIEKLNLSMFILYALNYPLTDSNYFWHVQSISESDLLKDDNSIFVEFKGVNTAYNHNLNSIIHNYNKNLDFIVDIENKKQLINNINENNNSNEISKLLIYINNILNEKSVKSFFLADCLLVLKKKLTEYIEEYNKLKLGNISTSYFYINKEIMKINKNIQLIFYNFILNILVELNKDFTYKKSNIIQKSILNREISEEENIFLKNCKETTKYSLYYNNFISNFQSLEELKVSLLFTDEYVNLKANHEKKNMFLNYFKIMDNFYSFKPNEDKINFSDIKDEDNKIINTIFSVKKFKEKPNNKLFSLDNDKIKVFLYYKKNKNIFNSFVVNNKKERDLEIKEKRFITLTILNHFYPFLKKEFFIQGSLIYIFSIVLPLFSVSNNILNLCKLLNYIDTMKYFKRYFIIVLIKSIDKYYSLNQEKGIFPEFTFENFIYYTEIIKNNLNKTQANSIIPNEEISLFFEKVQNKKKKNNNNQNLNNNINNNNNFVYQYEKEGNYVKKVKEDIVIKDKNNEKILIFNYNGKKENYNLILENEMYNQIFSIYEIYFKNDYCNLENFDNKTLIEMIVNLIYYNINNNEEKLKEFESPTYLLNAIILLKKLEKDINAYKSKNENKN